MPIMETILTVSHDILMIAGALCVILLLFILCYVLSLVMKVKSFVNQTQRTYNQMTMYVLEPFKFLTQWLVSHVDGSDDDDDEEMEVTVSKKKKK